MVYVLRIFARKRDFDTPSGSSIIENTSYFEQRKISTKRTADFSHRSRIQYAKKHNNQPYGLKPAYVWGILLRAEALGCTTALLISLKRSGYLEITGFSLCTNSYVELYVATIFLPFPSDFEDQNGDQQGISNKRQSHG